MLSIYDIHISTILELRSTMKGDKILTNTSRKSSIGSFSNVSLANNKEEDILEGTYTKCYILPLSVSCLMSFFYNILRQFSAQ